MPGVLIPEHAFISYSHLDQVVAQKVRGDLEAAGINTWIDEQLEPGTPIWEHAIRNAIAGSFAVVLIASPHAKDGPYVQAELLLAESNGRKIIPIWIEGDYWIECVPMNLSSMQYINCRGAQYATGIAQLVKKLQDTIDERSPTMQLLTKEEADKYREFILRYSTMYESRAANVTLLRQDYIYIELVNGDFVAMRYGAFNTIGELLNALYMEHLRKQFAPYMYGNQWLLGTSNNQYGTLMQLLLPWDWLSIPKNHSITQLQSDWYDFSPEIWFASSHLRYLRVLDRLPKTAFGVVTNSGSAITKMREAKKGYAFRHSLLHMVNNHSNTRHWLEYAITLSESPEEVNPQDYQYQIVIASSEEDDMRNYVKPGEVTRVVCVID
jgi:TIR domain